MKEQCRICGSYAVNPHLRGRKRGVDLDLCDVCYWRERYAKLTELVDWYLDILAFCNDSSPCNVTLDGWDEVMESLYAAESALLDNGRD